MTYFSNKVRFFHFNVYILKILLLPGRIDTVVGFPGIVPCIFPISYQVDVDDDSVMLGNKC